MKKHKNPLFLISGILLISLTHMRWGIGLLIFVAPLPFLSYLESSDKKRRWFYLWAALFTGWLLATAKIITGVMPLTLAAAYALPLSLSHLAGYYLYQKLKTPHTAFLLFPAVFTLLEWLQASFTPFGTWGAAAYTQLENLPMLQILSVLGFFGLSFILYMAAWGTYQLVKERKISRLAAICYMPLLLAVVFGSLRLTVFESRQVATIRAAAIGTDSTVGFGSFPAVGVRQSVQRKLLSDTKTAIDADASFIVWNEAATAVLPEEEAGLIALVSNLITIEKYKGALMVSWIIPLSFEPLKYENKYYIFDENGSIVHTYFKHHPVPGEPCITGTNELKVFPRSGSLVSGAICYDYDFPSLAGGYGKLGADIIGIPSSDWRGIDPIHTHMASFRAVENGHSIVRSTRWGLSATVDYHGRMTGRLSHFNSTNRILLANIPAKGVRTIYSRTGDLIIWLIVLYLILAAYKKYNSK